MLILAAAIRLTSRGPAIFAQERVGMQGRLFRCFKFRSMTVDAQQTPGLARAGDHRVTAVGRFLRRFKLDELPQLFNLLRGEISTVGPRPKLPQYSGRTEANYRPGITGPATLLFWKEEDMMRSLPPQQLDGFYAEHIQPLKARIDTCYLCRATPGSDLRMIAETVRRWVWPAARRQSSAAMPWTAFAGRPDGSSAAPRGE